MPQAKVPNEYRSKTPELLRDLAQKCELKTGSAGQKLLLEAAAEIEGGEEAYAVLVDEIHNLRKSSRTLKEICAPRSNWCLVASFDRLTDERKFRWIHKTRRRI